MVLVPKWFSVLQRQQHTSLSRTSAPLLQHKKKSALVCLQSVVIRFLPPNYIFTVGRTDEWTAVGRRLHIPGKMTERDTKPDLMAHASSRDRMGAFLERRQVLSVVYVSSDRMSKEFAEIYRKRVAFCEQTDTHVQ